MHNDTYLLILHGAIPAAEPRDLLIYLAWREGAWRALGHAPTWNKRVHAVDATGLTVTAQAGDGLLTVTLLADDFIPQDGQPLGATYTIDCSVGRGEQGRFTGQCGGQAVAGAVAWKALPCGEVNTDDCEIELLLADAHPWSQIDWMRILRVRLEYTAGRAVHAQALTQRGVGGIAAMPFDPGALVLTESGIHGTFTVVVPPHDYGPATDTAITYTLDGTVVGSMVGGTYRWARDGEVGTGWFKAIVRSKWPVGAPDTRLFRHPGMLMSATDLADVCAHLHAGDNPWTAGLQRLRDDLDGALTHAPRPMQRFIFERHHFDPGDVRDLLTDGKVAYGCALLWALTDDPACARKAAEVLDAYAETLVEVDPARGILGTAYAWPQFLWAAELLRHAGADWSATAQQRFAELIRTQVYPVGSSYVVHNNWMSWSICLRMAAAIFLEERGWYNIALQDFRAHVADYFGADGFCRETGRDLNHTQMSIAPLLAAAEMAWQQGDDLYGCLSNRLLTGIQFHLPFIAGDTTGWRLAAPPREAGTYWNMYELAYHHYCGRMGLSAPALEAVTLGRRPEGYHRIGWGTLTHARERWS